MKLGICILVGGKSSRMDFPKANLIYHNKTFFEILCDEFQSIEYKFISLNFKQHYQRDGYVNIYDEYEQIGPMSGIVSTFHQSDVDVLFVCSCDMPFVNQKVLYCLLQELNQRDGIFLKDDEHTYMTAGIYTRKLLPFFESQIEKKDYRLYKSLQNQNIGYIHVNKTNIDPHILLNINTKEDYQKLEGSNI